WRRSSRLEAQLDPELNLPGAGGQVRTPHLRTGLAKGICVGDEIVGLAELNAVEQVVALRPELQVGAFRKPHALLQNHVPAVHSGAVEVVAAKVAGAAPCGIREQTQVRPSLCARIAHRKRSARGIVVGALLLSGMRRVERTEDVIGKTAGEG